MKIEEAIKQAKTNVETKIICPDFREGQYLYVSKANCLCIHNVSGVNGVYHGDLSRDDWEVL